MHAMHHDDGAHVQSKEAGRQAGRQAIDAGNRDSRAGHERLTRHDHFQSFKYNTIFNQESLQRCNLKLFCIQYCCYLSGHENCITGRLNLLIRDDESVLSCSASLRNSSSSLSTSSERLQLAKSYCSVPISGSLKHVGT